MRIHGRRSPEMRRRKIALDRKRRAMEPPIYRKCGSAPRFCQGNPIW